MNIDDKFNDILSRKKTISIKDLIELKSFIIKAYSNDTMLDIIDLQKSQSILTRNYEDY